MLLGAPFPVFLINALLISVLVNFGVVGYAEAIANL